MFIIAIAICFVDRTRHRFLTFSDLHRSSPSRHIDGGYEIKRRISGRRCMEFLRKMYREGEDGIRAHRLEYLQFCSATHVNA